jgi:hypothetical protein
MDELDLLKEFRRTLPGPTEEHARALRDGLLQTLKANSSGPSSQWAWRCLRARRHLTGSVERVTPPVVRLRVGWRATALAAAVVAIAGVGVTYLVTHGASGAGSASDAAHLSPAGLGAAAGDRDLLAIFNTDEPLLADGTLVTLDSAAALVQYPIYRLQDQSMGQPEVWLSKIGSESGSTYEVALRYDADLVLTFGRWPEGTDPAEVYQRLAGEWDAGYVTTIGGHAAWVIPPGAREPESPPVSVVHVTIGDVEITLFGRMPVEQLVSLAGSLTPV